MISVLILTFNEERNLSACLESVSWSDDVLVLDSFSTDKTIEIARAAGVRVLQNRFVNFAEQRNFGLEHGGLKHEWVLHLDADELVTNEFKTEALRITRSGQKQAYRVPSKMMFQGCWLKYSGTYPTYQVRLGRRDRLRFKQVGHGQREDLPADCLGTLNEALLHYSFAKGMTDWTEKHRRYAAAEADHALKNASSGIDLAGLFFARDAVRRRRALKSLSTRLPCRAALRFFYMYLIRRGFLDGSAGFQYCRLLSHYESMIVSKTRELRQARAIEKLKS